MANKIKFIAHAVKWFDRVNGNTYHSVRVTRVKDGLTIGSPMQYGYGDQYRYTALNLMLQHGWIPKRYGKKGVHGGNDVYLYEREHNYPIDWNERHGLKKECIANGVV